MNPTEVSKIINPLKFWIFEILLCTCKKPWNTKKILGGLEILKVGNHYFAVSCKSIIEISAKRSNHSYEEGLKIRIVTFLKKVYLRFMMVLMEMSRIKYGVHEKCTKYITQPNNYFSRSFVDQNSLSKRFSQVQLLISFQKWLLSDCRFFREDCAVFPKERLCTVS